ncbi:serine/threonine protein kinase [Xylanibacter muris]|uniref:Serine/threonine protein kinase n=1 Tax=Xylanibacter muris TaxID=2736290 RepID=A0ABX2AKK3_9BACT|nr:serine/threonine-protein kinase [Xylanibacter muris]NPD91718.1 serine/threonine protein kinase [Xylanibacter muris]
MHDLGKYINEGILFDGHYRLIKLLSTEGGTADVWLAENYESIDTKLSEETDDVIRIDGTGVLVAIKIYRPKSILDVDGEQNFRSEFKTIFNCHHTNLLPTTDYSIYDGMPYLVMPFCENGSAESLVGKFSNEDDIWKFLSDVASGLNYLHSSNPPIIHQDIKPANILIDTNRNYCITDFGISVKSGVENDLYWDNESCGTTIYMPPERFKDGYKPDTSSDIWSLGATVYELLTGDVPFGDKGGAAQLDGIQIPPINSAVSKKIKSIIYACLSENPQKRPSAEYIAEYAQKKGKKNHYMFMGILSLITGSVFCILSIWNSKPKELDLFTIYRNSGDSILSLQKQETNAAEHINYSMSIKRLNEAFSKYSKALKERNKDRTIRDSLHKRITSIQNVITDLKEYKGICDTLDFVTNENLPFQIEVFSEKRDKMSGVLKNKINSL